MMFGFNQFFSAFGFQQPNIDPILERAEGIDDILDEDNIITIVKSQTAMQKFGDYIRKHPDMIQKLVKYIIEEPELHEQMDSKRCFKYPFVSSELFSCEIPLLINSLFEDLRTMSPTKQEEDDDDDKGNEGNEFMGLSRAKPSERVSAKMNGDNEEIVEQIDINCEEDDSNNEFLEKEKEEKNENKETEEHEEQDGKEQKDDDMPEVDKYVDEKIKHVIQKMAPQEQTETIKNDESHEFKSCNSSLNEENKQKKNDPILQIEQFEMVGIQLMEYLLSFLKDKTELNETSAGYWAKVITSIINKRGTDVMILFFNCCNQFMDYLSENANESFDGMMNFICCKSVADIVLKLVLLEVPSLEAKKILYYVAIQLFKCISLVIKNLISAEIILKTSYFKQYLCKLFVIINLIQELENISFVLSEIFNKYPNQYNGSQELVEFILTEENLNILFKIIIDQKVFSIFIQNILGLDTLYLFTKDSGKHFQIFQSNGRSSQLFLIYQNFQQQNNFNTFMSSADKTENKDDEIKQNLQQLLTDSKLQNCFQNFLTELILKLNEEQNLDELTLQFNVKIKPFGLGKLKLLEILYLGLKNQLATNSESIEENLKTTNFFKILLDYVKQYEWNNFLHHQIEKILLLVLQTSCGIRKQLFSTECNILQIIMDNLSQLYFFLSPGYPYKTTHGNLMILLKLGNEIMKLKSQEDDYITGIVEGDSKWQAFYCDVIIRLNKEMAQDLGGVNPREKKVTACDNEREIDLANIFKKFSAFFSNSPLGGSLNNNQNNDNADDEKKDGEDEDEDYNQLGKKYEEEDADDQFERGDENNYDPNEEGNDEAKEKMSVQQLKLQQLTAGGASSVTTHLSKAKNERNAAYAAYALKQKKKDEDEDNENSNIQEQFKEKQQRLLKDMNKNLTAELDEDEDFAKDQLQDEIQNQLNHMLEPQYYSNQFWDVTDYNSVDINEEMADLL